MDALAGQVVVGGEQGLTVFIADEEVHLRHHAGHSSHTAEAVIQLGLVSLLRRQEILGHLHDELGPHFHLVPLFAYQIVVAQGVKGRAQQQQRQQHHSCDEAELLPVDAAEPVFRILFHDFTSNL